MKKKSSQSNRTKVRFHWKLALATLAAAGAVGGSAYLLHAKQMQSMASAFRIKASDAQAGGKLGQAISHLEKYVSLHPHDAAAHADLAELIDEASETPSQWSHAKAVLSAAIGRCESQAEMDSLVRTLRRRLAKRHLQTRDFLSAFDEIILCAKEDPDPECLRILALSRYVMTMDDLARPQSSIPSSSIPGWVHRYVTQHATVALIDALKFNPGDEELTQALCSLLIEHPEKLRGSDYAEDTLAERKQHAMQFADALIEAKPDSPDAWLSHYRMAKLISMERAGNALETAVQKFPGDSRVALEMGLHLLQSLSPANLRNPTPESLDQLRLAEGYLRASHREQPRIPARTARVLGIVLLCSGRVDEALSMWRTGLENQPNDPSLHFLIVSTCIEQQNWDRADSALRAMDLAIASGSVAWSESAAEAIAMEARMHRGKYHLARGEHEAVIRLLEPYVALKTQLSSVQRATIRGLLGQAYLATRVLDKAAENFEAAFALDLQTPERMRLAANAWLDVGRPEKALQCEQAIEAKTIIDWYIVAKSILAQNARDPVTPAVWSQFDEAIANSRSPMTPGSKEDEWEWQMQLLELDARVVRAPAAAMATAKREAATALVELCHAHPDASQLQSQVMARLSAWGERDALAELTQGGNAQLPDSVSTWLEKVNELVRNDQKDAALAVLMEHLHSAEVSQQETGMNRIPYVAWKLCRSREAFESTHTALAEWAGDSLLRNRLVAHSMLDTVAAWLQSPMEPSDTPSESDVAIDSWNGRLEGIEEKLHLLEGETGTEWKAVRALRLLETDSRHSSREQLQEVEKIAHSLESHRPQWHVTYVILGKLAERRADWAMATKHYEHAITCGASQMSVYERLVAIWTRQGKPDAAREVLREIGASAGKSLELEEAAFRLLTMSEEQAIALARMGVQSRPSDPVAWIYMGLAMQRGSKEPSIADREMQVEQAYMAFERANQLQATQSLDVARTKKVLSALRRFYQSIGDRKKLTELHDRIQSMPTLEEATRWELLGSLEKALGRFGEAAESYQRAMQAGAGRLAATLELCDVWMRSRNFHDAIQTLESVVREFPENQQARHTLAIALSEAGDWDRMEQVLLESKHGNDDADRRLLAMLRCKRGTPTDIERALRLYEAPSRGDARVSAEDAVMLATILSKQIVLKLGKYADAAVREDGIKLANRYFLQALSEDERNTEVLSQYVEFLLATKQFMEAKRRLSELRKLQPDAGSFAVLEARLHHGQGNLANARQVLARWEEKRLQALGPGSDERDRLLVHAELATAYLAIEDVASADPLIDSIRAQFPEMAAKILEQGCRMQGQETRSFSIGKWLDWEEEESSPGSALRLILITSESLVFDSATQQRIDARLHRYETEYESQPRVLSALGDLWLQRDTLDRAIELYRKALVGAPDDIGLLNNLACLIAETTMSTDESLLMIERALEVGGRQPELLDSKGYVLSIAGRHEEAIPYFEESAMRGTDPRAWLHWYMALKRSGRIDEAEKILKRVNTEAMQRLHLTEEEKRELEAISNLTIKG